MRRCALSLNGHIRTAVKLKHTYTNGDGEQRVSFYCKPAARIQEPEYFPTSRETQPEATDCERVLTGRFDGRNDLRLSRYLRTAGGTVQEFIVIPADGLEKHLENMGLSSHNCRVSQHHLVWLASQNSVVASCSKEG